MELCDNLRLKIGINENSDIDVIMVSNYFLKIPFVKRMPLVLKKIRFKKHIDIICYTPSEFEKIRKTSIILKEALGYGEVLVS